MSLSGFKIAVGGIKSIPLISSLVLLLYKSLGEKRLDTAKLKAKKVVSKVIPSTPKKEKGDDKTPESLKSK
jgi:hypothetical protein